MLGEQMLRISVHEVVDHLEVHCEVHCEVQQMLRWNDQRVEKRDGYGSLCVRKKLFQKVVTHFLAYFLPTH